MVLQIWYHSYENVILVGIVDMTFISKMLNLMLILIKHFLRYALGPGKSQKMLAIESRDVP